MSNETLRVVVSRLGDTVLMRTVEMPERFRGCFAFTASNDITVKSADGPRLEVECHETIRLLGSDWSRDDHAATEEFDDVDDARRYYAMTVEALREAKSEMDRIVRNEPAKPECDDKSSPFDQSTVI